VNKTKDLLEAKVQGQEKKIEEYRQEQKESSQTFSDVQVSQMENLQDSYTQLLSKFEHVTLRMGKYEEENKGLEEEIALLRSELMTKNTPKPHLLELPSNFLMMEEAAKRQRNSIETDKSEESGEIELVLNDRKIS
jgi:hypothetical protein